MAGAYIAYRNWLDSDIQALTAAHDDAETSPGVSGSAANLLKPQRSRLWTGPGAAVDAANNAVGWTWTTQRRLRVLAILDHTLSTSYDTANTEIDYYAASTVWSNLAVSGLWESDTGARHIVRALSTVATNCTGARLRWDDPGSSSVQASILWASDAIYLDKGVDVDAPQSLPAVRRPQISAGRQLTRQGGQKSRRVIRVRLSDLTQDQAIGDTSVLDLIRFAGQSRPVMILPSTSSADRTRRQMVYGFVSSAVLEPSPGGATYQAQLDIRETF